MRIGPLEISRVAKAATVAPPLHQVPPRGRIGPGGNAYDVVRTTDLAELAAQLTGQDFGPGVPMIPTHPEKTEPRLFDYPAGYNTNTTPRSYEELGFPALRALSRSWDVAALCISRNIDDLRQLRWEIRPKAVPGMARDAVKGRRDRLEQVRAEAEGFWSTPDQRHSWSSWLRRFALELYETDAACLYLSMSRDDSKLYGVRVIDGTTISPLLDDRGEPPMAPMPAYRQIIKGLPWSMYMDDAELPPSSRRLMFDQAHLVYEPFWPRDDSPYGHPPMETVLVTVQRALARQVLDLSIYRDGTTPNDFWKMPKDWTGTQIAELQDAFDKLLLMPAERARLRFMPGGDGTGLEHGFIAPSTEAEEFLLHVGCAAYNRSPMEMGFIRSSGGAGLGGKSVANQQGKSSNKSVRAVALHIKAIVDRITQRHLSPELELVFPELEDTESALERAEAEDIRIKNGSLGLDEARGDRDLDPIGSAQPGASNLIFLGSNAPIRALEIVGQDPEAAPAGGANPATPSAVPGQAATPSGPNEPPPAETLAKADIADVVYRTLANEYPTELLDWVHQADWRFERDVPVVTIDHARRPGGRDYTNIRHIGQGHDIGVPVMPVVLVDTGESQYTIADGWHRTIAADQAGRAMIPAFIASGVGPDGPWDRAMHEAKLAKVEDPARADLAAWQRKALKALRAGRSAGVRFESDAIRASTRIALQRALPLASDPDEVRALFEAVP